MYWLVVISHETRKFTIQAIVERLRAYWCRIKGTIALRSVQKGHCIGMSYFALAKRMYLCELKNNISKDCDCVYYTTATSFRFCGVCLSI